MRGRRSVALVAALVCILWSASPAAALRLVLQDTVGDVAARRDNGTLVAAPRASYPDIKAARVEHREHDIALNVRYDDLRPRGITAAFDLTVGTPDGSHVSFDVIAEPGTREGYIEPHEGTGLGDFFCTEPRDPALPRYPTWTIDYATDRYRLQVPRTCLGEPEWVRVHFVTAVETRLRSLYDVAGRGRLRAPIGFPPPLSRPIYRSE